MGTQLRELGIALSFFTGAVFALNILFLVIVPDLEAKAVGIGVLAIVLLGMYISVSLQANNREFDNPVRTDRACEVCAEVKPTRWVAFKESRAYLVVRREREVCGPICRGCADRICRQFNRTNLTKGWWSLPGIMRTPLYVLGNSANKRMTPKKGGKDDR